MLPILLLLLLTTTTTTTATPLHCSATLDNQNPTTKANNAITDLGLNIMKQIWSERNILISPYSLGSLLTMLLVGSGGNTEKEIANVLRLNGKVGALSVLRDIETSLKNSADSQTSLLFANKIFLNEGQRIEDKECGQELLKMVTTLDFNKTSEASQTINSFVNASTKGKIDSIVTPTQLIRAEMVGVNAVYFEAAWLHPFPAKDTVPRPFYRDGHPTQMVPAMYVKSIPVRKGYSSALKAQVLEIPYSSGSLFMSVLLPLEEGNAGLDYTRTALTSVAFWDAMSDLDRVSLDIQLPKFDIKTNIDEDLKMALNTLGVKDLFTGAANLTSFTGNNLYVKEIMHSTHLSVDERGTMAAGVSGAVIVAKITNIIKLNRPFLFLIHSNDTVLFVGAYNKP